MKPRRMSSRPTTPQMPLPLHASRIFTLDSNGRAGVVAALARLLLEAVGPARYGEERADAQ
jgi:hypothetical protein